MSGHIIYRDIQSMLMDMACRVEVIIHGTVKSEIGSEAIGIVLRKFRHYVSVQDIKHPGSRERCSGGKDTSEAYIPPFANMESHDAVQFVQSLVR